VGRSHLYSRSFGVAASETCRTSTGSCSETLLATHDGGRSWTDITPPSLTVDIFVDDFDFVDPQRGWVARSNCATAEVHISRTEDAGRTWRTFPGAYHSCNAGARVAIDFVNGADGWLAHIEPTGSFATLARTTDGGASWSAPLELPTLARVSFRDRAHGWLGGTGLPWSKLFSTDDGGMTWTRRSVGQPPGYGEALRLYGLPTFFNGTEGVLPVTLLRGNRADIAFYRTSDGGRTWVGPSVLGANVLARKPKGWFVRPLASSIVSPGVWWVVAGDPLSVYVTVDGGGSWTVTKTDLPAAGEITAVDAKVAWVNTAYPKSALYVSVDGGGSWTPLKPTA
jgi:photosystem II stability/assembly factor-like uncharacterized protein